MVDLSVEVDIVTLTDVPMGLELQGLVDLVRFALERLEQSGRWNVSVVLTSDDHLRSLHRDFLGIDEETDVMTFPASAAGEPGPRGGDVIVSVERAAEQAREAGHSLADEVRFLVVHGLLHLCGWVDETEEARAAMHRRQNELIAGFDRASTGAAGGLSPV